MRVPAGDKGAASITNQRLWRPYGGVVGVTHGTGECHVRTFACCCFFNYYYYNFMLNLFTIIHTINSKLRSSRAEKKWELDIGLIANEVW